jgi:hypothetical protein
MPSGVLSGLLLHGRASLKEGGAEFIAACTAELAKGKVPMPPVGDMGIGCLS